MQEEAAAAVAVVLEAVEVSVEDTAHLQCMVVAEEVVVMVEAHQWDEVATGAATVLEVEATTHTEPANYPKPASPGKTALRRFVRHSQRLADELLGQRCAEPPTATRIGSWLWRISIPPLMLDPTIFVDA